MGTNYPAKYQLLSTEAAKRLNVVVQIQDLSTLFSLVPIYQKVRYGDPRVTYGAPGLNYGGLILHPNFKTYLMKEGLTISQKIEPEQARGSVSTISLSFLDKNQYMTQLCSPGVLLDEPLGNKLVTVYQGYQNSAFPDDYVRVFRGYISKTSLGSGKARLELSDANIKSRQTVFIGGANYLSASINSTQTNIPISVTDSFFAPVTAPDGSFDWQMKSDGTFDTTKCVRAFLKIDSEFMEYASDGIAPGVITARRGTTHAHGSTAAAHSNGAAVSNAIQLYGNPIDIILKVYLSGYGGPWVSNVKCVALGTTLDPGDPNNEVVLFAVDVREEYGLTVGDQVIISNSTAGNNGSYFIEDIQDSGDDLNRRLVLDRALTLENPATAATLAFRSQYDTLPTSCGVKNTPQDIDVQSFQDARALYFSASQYTFSLFQEQQQSGKEFLESEFFLPIGAYSITRNGRLSIAVTKPPLADAKLLQLDTSNVIDPQTIEVTRAINDRKFYNLVQYNYDVQPDGQTFSTTDNYFDTISATRIALTSLLPINSLGMQTVLGSQIISRSRGLFLLNRYKKAAYQIPIKVNWRIGSQVEIGDMVLVNDPGTPGSLQISNLETGQRGLGKQLFEVIGRSLRIADGYADLTLLSSLGFSIEQRYATISPSSVVAASSSNTTTSVKIQDSYGPIFRRNEKKKWKNFVGLPVVVRSYDWTRVAQSVLLGFASSDPYLMLLDTPLGFTPQPGDIVDVADYGTGTDPLVNQGYKNVFTFIDPVATIVTGVSTTQFTVSSGDAPLFNTKLPVLIRNADWSLVSIESNVLSVVGTTVTLAKAIGFTPSPGMVVELIGFKDGGGAYRLL